MPNESTPAVEAVFVPPRSADRNTVSVPIHEVTLLEDRARILRQGPLAVHAGLNRILIPDITPLLQDVSLCANIESGPARVSDARFRRAMRIQTQTLPDNLRELEEEAQRIEDRYVETNDARERTVERYNTIMEIAQSGLREIPEDASWGIANVPVWQETFASLFERARHLQRSYIDAWFEQFDLRRDLQWLATRRSLLERPDAHFSAWLEVDLMATEDATIELSIAYTTPGALWRPLHSATLREDGKALDFASSGVVWQNTGEDWSDVRLVFSTARASLGTEPPLLQDDLLDAHRRAEQTRLEARQVNVQSASVKGAGAAGPSSGIVDLPGVDDGGDLQNLKPKGLTTVPSDGRPCVVPLFAFTAPAETECIAIPEAIPQALIRSVAHNLASGPLLAGPIELIRDSGTVGWTESLFVASGEGFELSFGPHENIRIHRTTRLAFDYTHPTTHQRNHVRHVRLDISNLSDAAQSLSLTERVPVSEVAQVHIRLLDEEAARAYDSLLRPADRLVATTEAYSSDDDGMVTWALSLAPYAQTTIHLMIETIVGAGVDFDPNTLPGG